MRNALLIPAGRAQFPPSPSFRNAVARSGYAGYLAQLPLAAIGLALGLMPVAVAAAFAAILVALFSPGLAHSVFSSLRRPCRSRWWCTSHPEPDRRRGQHRLVSGGPHSCRVFDAGHRSLCRCPHHFHARRRRHTRYDRGVSQIGHCGICAGRSGRHGCHARDHCKDFPRYCRRILILMNIINCVMAQRSLPPRTKISARNRFIPT